ncbi:hypothetical protein Tco_0358648, partial [Tanacetum coccineum]
MVPSNNLGHDLAGKPVNETSYRGMILLASHLTHRVSEEQVLDELLVDEPEVDKSDLAGVWFFLSRINARTMSLSSATSDEIAGDCLGGRA